MLRPLSLAALLVALPPLHAAAQFPGRTTIPAGDVQRTAATRSFDRERLARMDRWMDSLVRVRRVPGAVVLLMREGQVEFLKPYGVRDLARQDPVRVDDIFRIASMTKAVTSLAVMMLWEEGKFGLDDPIGRYIPAFASSTVLTKFNPADSSYEAKATNRRITIRQLLTHTSGLDYADIGDRRFQAIYAKAGLTALGREGETLASKIDVLGKLPLAFEPGERWNYSLSIDVLGRLVEVVSGMPLDRFMRTRIFEPLRMRDTWFELPADRRNRLVTLHADSSGTFVPSHGHDGLAHADFPIRPVSYFAGGAGLSSTAADYARFLQLFVNGGELDGVRLLGRKTVDLILTNQTNDKPIAFGLGFELETPANDHLSPFSVGSFSWSGAFRTYYWADPKEKLVAVLMTNTYGGSSPVYGPFRTFVYSALR